MISKKPLPIGVDDFEKLIQGGYYYIDKTLLIKDLLDLKGEVNLFTRPRRFGKTLNLSMLQCFFEDTKNEKENAMHKALFDGLQIMVAGNKYTDVMGKFPVIRLTLKSAKQPDYEMAYASLVDEIAKEYERHDIMLNANVLTDVNKEKYVRIMEGRAGRIEYAKALYFLSQCLYKYYGQKVIILIDEYDVPLENAYFRGFYEKMADFIRSLLESGLKTNSNLEFAVITGCLRISKESIFTGLNHLNIISVLDKKYAEHFGFLPEEVVQIADYYGCSQRMDTIKKWYDGYCFGEKEIYNPWSVIKYMSDLYADNDAFPLPYWINTSSNDIVKRLIECAGREERDQIETLIAGNAIEIPIHEDITYDDMEKSGDSLWNFLYFTGYLTKSGERFQEVTGQVLLQLVIPNMEVRTVYERTIIQWFHRDLEQCDFRNLYKALGKADAKEVQKILDEQLKRSISFYDSAENFYHGFMTGVLNQSQYYRVKSNRESGDGRNDIMLLPLDLKEKAFVLELKVSKRFKDLETDAKKALEQIRDKHYDAELVEMGYDVIETYGIAFYRKNCGVLCGGGEERL